MHKILTTIERATLLDTIKSSRFTHHNGSPKFDDSVLLARRVGISLTFANATAPTTRAAAPIARPRGATILFIVDALGSSDVVLNVGIIHWVASSRTVGTAADSGGTADSISLLLLLLLLLLLFDDMMMLCVDSLYCSLILIEDVPCFVFVNL